MISGLKVINLPAGTKINRPKNGELFILETCQRTLVLGYNFVPFHHIVTPAKEIETYVADKAYSYLLETICGLKSKLLGENEITSQFKKSYTEYLGYGIRNSQIMSILEKLFMDAKKIRTSYLKEIGQQTYAGIARKLLRNSSLDGDILIIGSGQLAEDLIKLLSKKHRIFLSARNTTKALDLVSKYSDDNIELVEWNSLDAWSKFPFIMNTIGSKAYSINHHFFLDWSKNDERLFIDLGSPCVINTPFTTREEVYRLEDIFEFGKILNESKQQKVQSAHAAIETLVQKRINSFALSLPFGWEEVQFV
ncbi:hypothetical protein [Halobacteriovorax sp. JY17]|uniref:hypothetical protein n=1 Tax=Halobacteriovorax sp. JY17 TaxID=2014617 RepID=UPI000C5CCF8E|nr:hypothetical protein [Halobacteriovorax sp. JY17]PIK15978.1 MAG: hypothetical protein CES88_04415 [Halobacteriovorax sp. JY17]